MEVKSAFNERYTKKDAGPPAASRVSVPLLASLSEIPVHKRAASVANRVGDRPSGASGILALAAQAPGRTRIPGPDHHLAAAVSHHQAGRPGQAEQHYRAVLAARPDHAEAFHGLGMALCQTGRQLEGIGLMRQAIHVNPRAASYHANLGAVFLRIGRLDEAIASCRAAIALQPDLPKPQVNLSAALLKQGRLEEAGVTCRRAIALRPDDPEANSILGSILALRGHLEEAAGYYHNAIYHRPNDANLNLELGVVLYRLERLKAAEGCFRQAIALRPGFATAHNNLGAALKSMGRLDEAVLHYRRTIELKPDFADPHFNLGNLFLEQGPPGEAVACFERALAINPDFSPAWSNRFFAWNHILHRPVEDLLIEHRRFGDLVSGRVKQAFRAWSEAAPGQPLRVGLVSGDLRNHPVGYFLEGMLRETDPSRIAFLAFPTRYNADDLTARIKPCFTAWEPIHDLSDATAAQLIHSLDIHVLLDLSGHTSDNRLPVFGWRAAPVQATWLGYFGTTGVAEMDYIIVDPHVAPPEDAGHFTETMWPLPEICLSLTPPSPAIEVTSLPAHANGHVTFGGFNNLAKMTDAVVSVWSRILQTVPGSHLMLKALQFRDDTTIRDVHARFMAHGIGPDRLLIAPPSSRETYLLAYQEIDIALDPFPYPGVTTSFEALWMGVPVLTKRGTRFLSRSGEAIAHNAGLADWIASDEGDYVTKAVHFASDLDRLAGLRAGLRDRVLASPLFDTRRFARHFADAMWGMWEKRPRAS